MKWYVERNLIKTTNYYKSNYILQTQVKDSEIFPLFVPLTIPLV